MTARIVYRLEGISKHKIVYKTQHVIAGTKSSKNKDEAIEKQNTEIFNSRTFMLAFNDFHKKKCGFRIIEMNSKITILIIGCIAQSLGQNIQIQSEFHFQLPFTCKFPLNSV